MFLEEITSQSFESFKARAAGAKVVLLYPWANYRNAFLGFLMRGAAAGLLYHRARQSSVSLPSWLSDMLAALRQTEPDFGADLADALQDGGPADMGRALAEDLARIDREQVILYLDELDRLSAHGEFHTFMAALVDGLDDRCQLVVSSRLLTYEPWISFVNAGSAVVMGASQRGSDLIFSRQAEPKPQLEVYAFGQGHALSNGREIKRWDGALPRNLFFYFMDNPLVTRDQIFEILWPKLSIREATNVFHVTKRKITERISSKIDDGKNYELTSYSTGFYIPSDKLVRHYDVADFEAAIEGALLADDPRQRQRRFGQAIDLYKAPFLYPLSLPWIEARRKQLRMMYGEALAGMAKLRHDDGAWAEALGFYTRALRELPLREDAHRGAMQMYINLGRNADAVEHYRLLEKRLESQLGVAPSPQTRQLIESLA